VPEVPGVPDPLGGRVRGLFSDLAHAGEPAGPTPARILRGEAGRESLGTRVRFTLCIGAQAVLEARYRAYGCPYTLATCEWLARTLEGQPLHALQGGNPAGLGGPLDWAAQLRVPEHKLGRLLVVEDALRNALSELTIP
jgi:NifU-like protein involved in Fe-S cluster formation